MIWSLAGNNSSTSSRGDPGPAETCSQCRKSSQRGSGGGEFRLDLWWGGVLSSTRGKLNRDRRQESKSNTHTVTPVMLNETLRTNGTKQSLDWGSKSPPAWSAIST